jgi:transcription elongation factor Elf1
MGPNQFCGNRLNDDCLPSAVKIDPTIKTAFEDALFSTPNVDSIAEAKQQFEDYCLKTTTKHETEEGVIVDKWRKSLTINDEEDVYKKFDTYYMKSMDADTSTANLSGSFDVNGFYKTYSPDKLRYDIINKESRCGKCGSSNTILTKSASKIHFVHCKDCGCTQNPQISLMNVVDSSTVNNELGDYIIDHCKDQIALAQCGLDVQSQPDDETEAKKQFDTYCLKSMDDDKSDEDVPIINNDFDIQADIKEINAHQL